MGEPMELCDGARVAVVGGGPAGSLTAYFMLDLAARVDLKLNVDIYEARDFAKTGPAGCNMCGGIVSESLVQLLATEGINLPENVVQRGIEAYVLHCDNQAVRMATPLEESRIAALHRGSGPKDCPAGTLESFDGHLLRLARERGAEVVQARVQAVDRDGDGRVVVQAKGREAQTYDLLVGAAGINTSALTLFEGLGLGFKPPAAAKAYICEIHLGREVIQEHLGNAMHVFLLDLPRLEFAAAIPKGDYVTVCMLGRNIDQELVDRFMNTPEVRSCLPIDWTETAPACRCMPKLSLGGAKGYYGDRVVLLGDSGVSRLYKDGIGAAYRTAKACALTTVLHGVAKTDFDRFFAPMCRRLERDNALGKLFFTGAVFFRWFRFLRQGMLAMVRTEQARTGGERPMSTVMWNAFTGSAPYFDIVMRAFRPDFWAVFGLNCLRALAPRRAASEESTS